MTGRIARRMIYLVWGYVGVLVCIPLFVPGGGVVMSMQAPFFQDRCTSIPARLHQRLTLSHTYPPTRAPRYVHVRTVIPSLPCLFGSCSAEGMATLGPPAAAQGTSANRWQTASPRYARSTRRRYC